MIDDLDLGRMSRAYRGIGGSGFRIIRRMTGGLAEAREELRNLERDLREILGAEFEWFLTKTPKQQSELIDGLPFSKDPTFLRWRAIKLTIETVEHNVR